MTPSPLAAIRGSPHTICQFRAVRNNFVLHDAGSMLSCFRTDVISKALWVVSPTLRQIVWDVKTSFGEMAGGTFGLLGIPLVFSTHLPALGEPGDVLLINSEYLLTGSQIDEFPKMTLADETTQVSHFVMLS